MNLTALRGQTSLSRYRTLSTIHVNHFGGQSGLLAKTFHARSAPDTHPNHGSATAMPAATARLRAGNNETAGERGTC